MTFDCEKGQKFEVKLYSDDAEFLWEHVTEVRLSPNYSGEVTVKVTTQPQDNEVREYTNKYTKLVSLHVVEIETPDD